LLDEQLIKNLNREEVDQEAARQTVEVHRRAKLYRSGKLALSAKDKVAIIVDDGITTGYNIRPAVSYIKAQHPKKIVVAIPVAPRASLEAVREMVDEIVTLLPPETFGKSVDEHYKEFVQPDDMEVIDAFLHSKIKEPQKPFHADITLVDDKKFFSSSE
jgi:predicted phosphoribosyltransferase